MLDRITQQLLALSTNAIVVLIVINVLVFIAGYLLDGISIFYVFLPIFMPLVARFGWDPVWFGVMITVNVAIGQVTPPVAVNLYVAANIAKLRFEAIAVAVWPFVGAMLAALVIVAAWPGLSTWLPGVFKLR